MKPSLDMPPAKVLRQLLRYDRRTGKLYFKKRPLKYFSSTWRMNNWNSRCAGKEALSTKSRGYLCGPILGKNYFAHRVIWCMVHGYPPSDQIDHEDGDRSNNRLKNLRDAGDFEQRTNSKIRNDNKTGHMGVVNRRGRWCARIKVRGKTYFLGGFSTFEEAVVARKAGEKKYGFHKNHGRKT